MPSHERHDTPSWCQTDLSALVDTGHARLPPVDIILLENPKEREPRRAYLLLLSNSSIRQMASPLMMSEPGGKMRQEVLPWVRFLHMEM